MNGRLYRLSKGAAQVECFQSARIDGAKSALVYIRTALRSSYAIIIV